MGITLGTLIGSNAVLNILNQQKGFNSTTAYRIMKNVKLISAELEDYEKQRIILCEKYSNKDEEGNPIITEAGNYDISPDNLKDYIEELNNLKNEIVEIPLKTISLEEINPAELSPVELAMIEFMLEE